MIFCWWGIKPPPTITMPEMLSTSFVGGRRKSFIKVFIVVCFVAMWSIWSWKNHYVHERIDKRHVILYEDVFAKIQSLALLWISNALIETLIWFHGSLT